MTRRAAAASTDLTDLGRQLTIAAQRNATDAVMLHQAVADRLGLHVTDLRCINLLRTGGPATPGELAARTGLTTGAVTRMIDRLIKSDFVTRDHDEQDRRRVIISLTEDRTAEISRLYEPLAREFGRLVGDYSAEQVELILGLFNRLHDTSLRVTAMLREAG
ncbi:MarR family winged helix-turn-helix transcriptional regulator [Nocardia miyunensis]|uniref:MarR family winged helix-turn-helix transcriptional regulator n=1 Tax=Nocardia miyunensis TaxID=282684 RepID=UPI00082E657D|nr:MarR family transcriptional regulator [Nocardia miyunensis]